MSTTIDERVVEMRFDNKQFENNVQTSLSSLDKLKNSLNMHGAAKGFEEIDNAAKKINMSGLGSAVESVRMKFSALEVMAVTALANITNSAVNAGKRVVSAFTFEPVMTGFQEYETQINAVQTILANTESKGSTLKDVNAALDELNLYADKTIYNFTEMTRNIGTFTAAGVDLDTSVSAIKGIANLAAVSGSNSQQASTAMYQLSQALASGTVKLQDWNSVVNAGMGGQVFQDALKETAQVHGIAIDQMIEDEGSFRETLKKGWLTSDILTETLSKFTGDLNEEQLRTMGYTEDQIASIIKMGQTANDAATKVKTFTQLFDTLKEAAQSGWTQSWEIIVGDFEEAKKLLTELGDTFSGIINFSAEARNTVLQGWKDLGGRTALIEALRNAFEGVASIIKPIKEAFREIFPPITAQQLYNLTEGLRKLTEHMKLSDKTSANLKNTFKGLFAVLDIVRQIVSAVFKAICSLLGGVGNIGSDVLGVTGSFGEWLVKLNEFIKQGDVFNKIFGTIANVIKTVADGVKSFVKLIADKLVFPGFEMFHSLLERVHTRMPQVGNAIGGMKSGVVTAFEAIGTALANCKFIQLLEALWSTIKLIASGIAGALGKVGSAITDSIGNANFSGIIDLLNGVSFGAIAVGISKFVGGFRKAIDEVGSIKESFVGILDSVRGCFEAYQSQLKAGTLLKIAAAIAILTASLLTLSLIDSEKLNVALGSITVLFADLMGSMAVFNKISGQASGVIKSTTAMIGMSVAILILASALKKLGDLNPKQLAVGLTGVVGLTALMISASKIMGKGGKTVIKGAARMVIFAVSIKVLASACRDLSVLNWSQLAKGLVGVGVLLAEVSMFMNTAKFSGKTITTATGIVILSAAIKVLASACSDFAAMKWKEIGKGLSSIGIVLAEITLFTNLTGNAKHVFSTGIALIAIAGSMKIFASAVKDFSSMQWNELARGLTGMAGALTAVTVAVNFMPKNMIRIGTGLIAISAALLIVAFALDDMGSMEWDEVAKSLVALGGSMSIIALGLNAMKGTLSGSAAMVVAAAGLALLTPILSILGAMRWTSIAKGLVTLAGAFAVIGVAGLVLTPIIPAILGLSGAFALIGVAVLTIGAGLLAAGAGLSALAIGFDTLAAGGIAGATAIVAALTVIITGIAELIPVIAAKIGEAIVEICRVIGESAGAIGEAVKEVILMLIDVLVECVPAIADGALKLVVGVLEALVKYTPQIVDSIFQFLIGVLEGIARNLPELIKAAVDVLMSFFAGIVDVLKGIDTETLLQGIVGIGLLSAIMLALSAVAGLIPGAMVGVLGMGAVVAELALVLAAVGALAQIPGLQWLINEGGNLLQDIGTAIGKFIGGIVGGFMSGVSAQFPQIGSDLSAFMTNVQPFIDGASSIDPTMLEGVKALAEVILILTAADILDGLTSWLTGGSSLSGFAEELVPFGTAMKAFSEEIAGIDGSVISNAATAGKTLAEMADTLPGSGGVFQFFAGEHDMALFGEQLIPFGRAMKDFGNAVAGIDGAVISEAATAGKALAEMADTVPNSGGVVEFFTGGNDLDMFGEQLIPFGKAMKEYSLAVTGINADVITNSATAGKALVELADTVPNSGGLVSFFTGDNDLDTFGAKLVPFGQAIKDYSLAVTGLDADVVTNSANAAKALVELSNNLPNEGGLVSWFTGDNDIAVFGEKLADFGRSFESYYNSIGNVNVEHLNGVLDAFCYLVDLANGISNVDTSSMSLFADELTRLGNAGLDGFINAFTDADSRVRAAADNMLATFIDGANAKKSTLISMFTDIVDSIISKFEKKQQRFNTIGNAMITSLTIGARLKEMSARNAFVLIINGCLTAVRNKFGEFLTSGKTVVTKFITGLRSKGTTVGDIFVQMVNNCLIAAQQKHSEFYDAGKYLVEGFKEGITDYAYLAKESARSMARAAAESAAKELDEHSPSKVGEKIGGFFGMGFVNSILVYADKSYKAGTTMAAAAKDGLSNAVAKIKDFIEGEMDTQPTIRPVLDLSEVRSHVGKLSAILSRSQASKISSAINHNVSAENQNDDKTASSGNSYSFVQNNYSPKALANIDIYRQTKNQFSALKGLVET